MHETCFVCSFSCSSCASWHLLPCNVNMVSGANRRCWTQIPIHSLPQRLPPGHDASQNEWEGSRRGQFPRLQWSVGRFVSTTKVVRSFRGRLDHNVLLFVDSFFQKKVAGDQTMILKLAIKSSQNVDACEGTKKRNQKFSLSRHSALNIIYILSSHFVAFLGWILLQMDTWICLSPS